MPREGDVSHPITGRHVALKCACGSVMDLVNTRSPEVDTVLTINPQQYDDKDEFILNKIFEMKEIRLAELSRHVDLSIGALRWRVLDLASKGYIRIERNRGKVTLYPSEALTKRMMLKASKIETTYFEPWKLETWKLEPWKKEVP